MIGASAGGMGALRKIVRPLPADLQAAIFVVMHLSPESPSVLAQILMNAGGLKALNPDDGDPIEPSRIYVAPPDHHMLIESGRVRITHGPRENRHRPAIDSLFRTEPWNDKVTAAKAGVRTPEGEKMSEERDERISGTPSVFTCPDCNGTLWELQEGDVLHFRCRVGHAFSADGMHNGYSESVDDSPISRRIMGCSGGVHGN